MDMIRPNHLFSSNFSYRVAFFPCFILTGMFSCTAAYILTKACSVVLMKEQEEEVRRIVFVKVAAMRWGDISDLTSQSSVWSGWRQLVVLHLLSIFFFFLPGSFALNDVAVTTPAVHKHTGWHLQEGRKKKNLCILISSPHTHTLCPSPPRPLSSQRHRDIFISRKALTLMKHRRHKYISMIFHIWLLPPLSWHTRGFLSVNLSQRVTYQIVLLHFSDNFTFKNRHLIMHSDLKPH